MKKIKIAVIIVSYNGRDYLPDCLYSLKQQTVKPFQIILVDNNSNDDSVLYVKENYPEVIVIENKKNIGFARGNNIGISEALRKNSDYIYLLNQDTICDKDCLKELAKAAQSISKKFFAFQSLLLCWPEKDMVQNSGCKMQFLGFGYSGDYKKPVSQLSYTDEFPSITYASGAAMFINVKALAEVGLLDHDLFMYHEDSDICIRARFLGYDILLAPKSIVYHKYTEGVFPHRFYWSERNRLITFFKFYKLPTLILLFPLVLFMEFGIFGYCLFSGWFFLKIKSYFSFLLQIPKTLVKRRRIQSSRKISDKEFSQYLENKFSFAGFTHPLLKYIVNPIFGIAWKVLRKSIQW
ncbi:glycosyltransferase family 2 protein [Patescibacteria group bacterium AH-259-L07]|nr:glycosyltransferase family 2 protein [Patescibacteria group bacterium AH-259-L07]